MPDMRWSSQVVQDIKQYVDGTCDDIKEDVARLSKDMYYGSGRDDPSMTARMKEIEKRMDNMESWREQHEENWKWMKRMMIGTLFTIVASSFAIILSVIVHSK